MHGPEALEFDCPGCSLTHTTEGPDLIFRNGDEEWRMTQQEWFEQFWKGIA